MTGDDFMDFSKNSKRWTLDICEGWKFKYLEKYSSSQDYFKSNYDDIDWEDINIPFVWQMKGYASPEKKCENVIKNLNRKINKTTGIYDKPIGTGYYRKTFELPLTWDGRSIFMKIGGVKSSVEVWINEKIAGSSFGTMGDINFDITGFLNPGINLIALKVQRFSNASFLDCSLEWFLSGIFRKVELYSEPEIHINDIFVRSTFDDEYEDARFCVETWVENKTDKNRDLKLELIIEDKLLMTAGFVVNRKSEEKVYICKLIEKPSKWDNENPHLYEVDIVLKNNDDEVLSVRKVKHGFRQVEIRKSQFLVNGKPVIFKGVNRVGSESLMSSSVGKTNMEEDILILKRNNINAVLTSDFPSDSEFYRLCDEYGIFVVSELGINTSLAIKKLPDGYDWNKAAINRITNTVNRDKNHPSIIMWYLGRDTGCGLDYRMMKEVLDELDDSRPVSYIGNTGSIGGDVLCTMYPTIETEINIGKLKSIKNFFKDTKALNESKSLKLGDYIKKPVFCSKLSYIEGNCMGNLYEHVVNYEKYNNLCGGFISNMKDVAVTLDDTLSIEREGVIDSAGIFKPMFYEIKKVFQNISTSIREDGESIVLKFKNNYRSMTFDDFILDLRIAENGREIYKSDVIIEIKAVEGETFFEFTPNIEISDNCEYILTVSWKLKKALEWAPEGFEVAWDEFVLYASSYRGGKEDYMDDEPFTVLETGEYISIKNSEYSVIINRKTGNIKNINLGRGNILYNEVVSSFDRDETDTDKRSDKNNIKNILTRNSQWNNALKKRKVVNSLVEEYPDKVIVNFEIEYPLSKGPAILTYEIRNNCRLLVHNEIEPMKEMTRFGMEFNLAEQFDFVKYYGRGPQENYVDRKRGAKTSIYEIKMEDFNYAYAGEQERGNRTGVRWMKALSDINSVKVESAGEENFDFSIRQCEEKTVLNVDYGQKGLGGDTATGSEILDKYRLKKDKRYKYTFEITLKGEPYEV
jgi:beta-galactosidase